MGKMKKSEILKLLNEVNDKLDCLLKVLVSNSQECGQGLTNTFDKLFDEYINGEKSNG